MQILNELTTQPAIKKNREGTAVLIRSVFRTNKDLLNVVGRRPVDRATLARQRVVQLGWRRNRDWRFRSRYDVCADRSVHTVGWSVMPKEQQARSLLKHDGGRLRTRLKNDHAQCAFRAIDPIQSATYVVSVSGRLFSWSR
jgi:hypothetical protein